MEINTGFVIWYLLAGYFVFIQWLINDRLNHNYYETTVDSLKFMLCLGWPIVLLVFAIFCVVEMHKQTINELVIKYWEFKNWWKSAHLLI